MSILSSSCTIIAMPLNFLEFVQIKLVICHNKKVTIFLVHNTPIKRLISVTNIYLHKVF